MPMIPELKALKERWERLDKSKLTRAQLELWVKQIKFHWGGETLLNFIQRTRPHEPPPKHLQLLIRTFQRARTERLRVLLSMPPRAGKTTTVASALSWWNTLYPDDLNCYASYNSDFAEEKCRGVRDAAKDVGVVIDKDHGSAGNWRIDGHSGGMFSAGLNAGITGRGVNGIFVVDDPYKNQAEASSPIIRDGVLRNFRQVVMTRLEGKASCIVIHTRWMGDDLIGTLKDEPGWEHINIPAIAMEGDLLGRKPGEPLWPDRHLFTLEALEYLKKIDEFTFAALYQGQPIADGSRIFYGEPKYWDPKHTDLTGCVVVIGVDPAATEKTSADFSEAYAMAIKPPFTCPTVYLLDGYKEQREIPKVARDLVQFQLRNFSAPMKVEAVGGFKAVPQLLKELAPMLRIDEITPFGDKKQRAQLFASAFNDGRVFFPMTDPYLKNATQMPPWVAPLLSQLRDFTGAKGGKDDGVDACSHGFNSIAVGVNDPQVFRGAVQDASRWA